MSKLKHLPRRSIAAGTGGGVGPHYASSKSALHGLLHWIAVRYAKDGIVRLRFLHIRIQYVLLNFICVDLQRSRPSPHCRQVARVL